jgi:hypothetical protein
MAIFAQTIKTYLFLLYSEMMSKKAETVPLIERNEKGKRPFFFDKICMGCH